jgi:hypothetical protein
LIKGSSTLLINFPENAVCQILWNHLISHRTALGATAQFSDLKERQVRVWDSIKTMDESLKAISNEPADEFCTQG